MKDVIRKMQQSTDVVHVIGSAQADELAKAGLVRKTVVSPPAPQGRQAVNLTTLGKAWKGDKIEPMTPEPIVAVEPVAEEGVRD